MCGGTAVLALWLTPHAQPSVKQSKAAVVSMASCLLFWEQLTFCFTKEIGLDLPAKPTGAPAQQDHQCRRQAWGGG